jgi:sulfur-oxidizing protein SoxA
MNWIKAGLAICFSIWCSFVWASDPPENVKFEDRRELTSLTGEPGDPQKGHSIIIDRKLGHCIACHKIPRLVDVPFQGNIGPSLSGVADRYTEPELRAWVVNPESYVPGTIMPAFHRINGLFRVLPDRQNKPILTAEQVEDVVAFLLTLNGETKSDLTTPLNRYDPGSGQRFNPPAGSNLNALISGYNFQISQTQEMQDDDMLNPGFLWLDQGRELWEKEEGRKEKSCRNCHDDAGSSMKGVGASYPKYRPASGKVVNIEQRVNICRTERMEAEPWQFNSDEMLAMTVFVKHQSRGMPVKVDIDGPSAPWFERGKKHFFTRRGQFDMNCADCHTANFGKLLRGDLVSQGHTNAYPIYALGDGRVRPLHKLLWHCNDLMRSTPFDFLSDEYVALELYLAWRGQGLPVETPGVRW